MRLPRRDFYLIKTAFGITKDDAPYISEDLIDNSAEDLAVDSLQEKKRLYFITLQQKEIEQLRKENNEYRKKDYFLKKTIESIAEHMKDFALDYTVPKTENKPYPEGKLLLEFPVVDLHLGRLSWKPETGEHYDYKIARERFLWVTDNVCQRVSNSHIEKIIYPIGNDFFQTDTTKGTTTKGTFVDTDSRQKKLLLTGAQMLVESIDRFSRFAPVVVVLVPGNHDYLTSYSALLYLWAWYKDSKRVTVWEDPKTRKYIEHGVNLIGYAHGDKEGKRIAGNMPAEAPKAWGRTMFREYHLAHLHHERAIEENGITVRRLSTMASADAYEHEHGFIGTICRSQSFLWHRKRGLEGIMFSTIDSDMKENAVLSV